MVTSSKWSNVKLLKALAERIEKMITNYPELGYNSVSDFVNDAVRRRLEKLNKNP